MQDVNEEAVTCPICAGNDAGDQLVDRSVHVFCCLDCLPHVTATFAAYGERDDQDPELVA